MIWVSLLWKQRGFCRRVDFHVRLDLEKIRLMLLMMPQIYEVLMSGALKALVAES